MRNQFLKTFTASLFLFCFITFAIAQKDLKTVRDDVQSDGYVGVALLVGNSDYQFATKLNSPVNDANDMAKVLGSLGFKVLHVRANASLNEMETAIAEFERELTANKGVGVFYYSGHGVQSKGLNYLIPVDANIPTEAFLRQKAIDLESVMGTMEGATNKAKIVILDACRNDPFKGWANKGTSDKGLAKVDAPDGMLIAFATSPKKTAADGLGRNSPYTEILLQEISKPNISINDMLQNVRTNLMREYNQISWENTSLLSRFCFASCEGESIGNNLTDSIPSNQGSPNNVECANCIPFGPKKSDTTHYLHSERKYRLYASIFDNSNQEFIDNEIEKLFLKQESHLWDNNWYYQTLKNGNECLLLIWHELISGKRGWVLLRRNDTDIWFFKTNGQNWKLLEEGNESYDHWSDTPVKIYFKAPNLKDGWSKEDIQYKFSW